MGTQKPCEGAGKDYRKDEKRRKLARKSARRDRLSYWTRGVERGQLRLHESGIGVFREIRAFG